MIWTVSVQFSRAIAYHRFFSLINRGKIENTRLTNYSHQYQIIEFTTTTQPEEDKIKKMGSVVSVKIVEVNE